MKVKIIGVNPIHPKDSGLISEGDLTQEKAIRFVFKRPIGILQLRLVGEELVLYIGHPIDADQYAVALEEAKQRIAEEYEVKHMMDVKKGGSHENI